MALLTARKCDELLDQTATFARAVKASLAGDGGGVSGADADVQVFPPAPADAPALTQLSNYLTLKGSLSAVSKPNFASKYALELGSI